MDWANAGVGVRGNNGYLVVDGVRRVYVDWSWPRVSGIYCRRPSRQSLSGGKHIAFYGVARSFDGSGAMTNRTWADAAVEIFTAVLTTIGPIGLGVALIIVTIGAAIWMADRRGWMRPPAAIVPNNVCRAVDAERLDRVMATLEWRLGSNDAKHDVTHDMIRELRRDIL